MVKQSELIPRVAINPRPHYRVSIAYTSYSPCPHCRAPPSGGLLSSPWIASVIDNFSVINFPLQKDIHSNVELNNELQEILVRTRSAMYEVSSAKDIFVVSDN